MIRKQVDFGAYGVTVEPSSGYGSEVKVTVDVDLTDLGESQAKVLQVGLKTSSGFGGCNGALVLKKTTEAK